MWEMFSHEQLDCWLLWKPWETRHVHISLWQQRVAADGGGGGGFRTEVLFPLPLPTSSPLSLFLTCSSFELLEFESPCSASPSLMSPSPRRALSNSIIYPPNNASGDSSWEDERYGNTGFGGRLTRVQEPPEMSHVIAISLPGESQRQAGSQFFFVWSFHNSILLSPHFFSLCRSLLNLESVLLFHLSSYFPTKTECFPYRAFGLGWELLLLSMTNGIFSLIKTIQNQQNVKCVCKAERLFFDFYLFVGSTGAPHC